MTTTTRIIMMMMMTTMSSSVSLASCLHMFSLDALCLSSTPIEELDWSKQSWRNQLRKAKARLTLQTERPGCIFAEERKRNIQWWFSSVVGSPLFSGCKSSRVATPKCMNAIASRQALLMRHSIGPANAQSAFFIRVAAKVIRRVLKIS